MKKNRDSLKTRKNKFGKEDWQIYSFLIPAATLIIIFKYLPMWGIVLSFQNFRSGSSIFSFKDVDWVGFKWYLQFVQSINFTRILVNTLRLSFLNLAFGFTTPIVFALALNEVRNVRYKKLVQTASYLPYFISAVVVAGVVLSFLQKDGLVNNILSVFGVTPQEWIVHPKYFPVIYTFTNVWKTFGFASILYFSSLSTIDPTLYEAAHIDGASRLQQIIYITLPSIMFVIAIQFILLIGNILKSDTFLILLLYRPSNYSTSDVIGTYIYRVGIENGRYSYTTAVGVFMSVIGLFMTVMANKFSNKLTGHGLW